MADKKNLTITLRKEVADEAEAQALTNVVKAKLADNPTVVITSQFTNRFDLEDPE